MAYDPWEIGEDYDPRHLCPKCGEELGEQSYYCQSCGWPESRPTMPTLRVRPCLALPLGEVAVLVRCPQCKNVYSLYDTEVAACVAQCPTCRIDFVFTKHDLADAYFMLKIRRYLRSQVFPDLGEAIFDWAASGAPPGVGDYGEDLSYVRERMDQGQARYSRCAQSHLLMYLLDQLQPTLDGCRLEGGRRSSTPGHTPVW